jgi:hypothetical protein
MMIVRVVQMLAMTDREFLIDLAKVIFRPNSPPCWLPTRESEPGLFPQQARFFYALAQSSGARFPAGQR